MTKGNSAEEIRSMMRSSFPNKAAIKLRLRLSAGKNLLVTEYFPTSENKNRRINDTTKAKNAILLRNRPFSLFHF
jgi:hypothetical protein